MFRDISVTHRNRARICMRAQEHSTAENALSRQSEGCHAMLVHPKQPVDSTEAVQHKSKALMTECRGDSDESKAEGHTLAKNRSASEAVTVRESSLLSRHSLANLAPSISSVCCKHALPALSRASEKSLHLPVFQSKP